MQLIKSPVIFDREQHIYKFGDVYLRGITGIISTIIFPNKYKDVPHFILEKAAERGSSIHLDIENYEDGFPSTLPETELYIDLMQRNQINHLASEFIVSDEKRFASAIDKVDEDFNLYDIKTTYTLDKDYLSWQLSILAYLFELQTKEKAGKLFAIWIKNDSAKLIEITKINDSIIEEFLEAAYNGDFWVNPIEKSLIGLDDKICKALEFEGFIKMIEEQKSKIEDSYNLIKEQIEEEMVKQDIKKWETDNIILTRVLQSTSVTFDSKRFKEDNPILAKEYEKESLRKGYLKITLKK